MVGSFNNWNIIHFTNKTTSTEDFDMVNKVVLDYIISNIASLVQLYKYGAINAAGPTTIGYYVVKFLFETYTLQ